MLDYTNLEKQISKYDYYILDIWGVIHDGDKLYPSVLEKLELLRKHNKNICFLSNAPRRAQNVEKILNNLGVTNNYYDFIMSSGEAIFMSLENYFKEGKYYYLGPKKDQDLLNGKNGFTQSQNLEEADFVIVTGFVNDITPNIEEEFKILDKIHSYNLPMICANPDIIVIKQDGRELFCAGLIAKKYSEIGGKVLYFGKPYKTVYDVVMQKYNLKDKSKILAIGDGVETDILGANNFNIDCALVTGGILSNELNVKYGEIADITQVKILLDKYKVNPTYLLSGL